MCFLKVFDLSGFSKRVLKNNRSVRHDDDDYDENNDFQ